jgi:type II secretory pathway predicted ATPase ExeA
MRIPARARRHRESRPRGRARGGTSQGQVILDPKEVPVSQPHATVEVALERHSALATLGSQGGPGQNPIIADLDQLSSGALVSRPRLKEPDVELSDLFQAVAGPCLGKSANRVVVSVGLPELRTRLRRCRVREDRQPASHDLHILG